MKFMIDFAYHVLVVLSADYLLHMDWQLVAASFAS